jgi:hypothetical protein
MKFQETLPFIKYLIGGRTSKETISVATLIPAKKYVTNPKMCGCERNADTAVSLTAERQAAHSHPLMSAPIGGTESTDAWCVKRHSL